MRISPLPAALVAIAFPVLASAQDEHDRCRRAAGAHREDEDRQGAHGPAAGVHEEIAKEVPAIKTLRYAQIESQIANELQRKVMLLIPLAP